MNVVRLSEYDNISDIVYENYYDNDNDKDYGKIVHSIDNDVNDK